MIINYINSFSPFIHKQNFVLNSRPSPHSNWCKQSLIFRIFIVLGLGVSAYSLFYCWNKLKKHQVKAKSSAERSPDQNPSKLFASRIPVKKGSPLSSSQKTQEEPPLSSKNGSPPVDRQRQIPQERPRVDPTNIIRDKEREVDQSTYEQLEKFYQNQGTDSEGRTLLELQEFSFDQKEDFHNYIQWMFPTNEKSNFNSDAPLLTAQEYKTLSENPLIIKNLKISFGKILEFYGLEYDLLSLRVKETSLFSLRSQNWFGEGNHNHMRISRILKCLNLFGLHDEMNAFYAYLQTLKPLDVISKDAFKYYAKNILPIVENS